MRWITTFIAVLVTWGLTSLVAAETGHGHDVHHSPHAVGVFMGMTDPDDASAEATLGLEYEYRFNQSFGLGAVVERTSEAHHGDGATVGVGTLNYHVANFRLTAGFGKEWVDDHGSEWLQRLGVAYDIELGPVALAPTISVDFVDGERIPVYGLVLLKHF